MLNDNLHLSSRVVNHYLKFLQTDMLREKEKKKTTMIFLIQTLNAFTVIVRYGR